MLMNNFKNNRTQNHNKSFSHNEGKLHQSCQKKSQQDNLTKISDMNISLQHDRLYQETREFQDVFLNTNETQQYSIIQYKMPEIIQLTKIVQDLNLTTRNLNNVVTYDKVKNRYNNSPTITNTFRRSNITTSTNKNRKKRKNYRILDESYQQKILQEQETGCRGLTFQQQQVQQVQNIQEEIKNKDEQEVQQLKELSQKLFSKVNLKRINDKIIKNMSKNFVPRGASFSQSRQNHFSKETYLKNSCIQYQVPKEGVFFQSFQNRLNYLQKLTQEEPSKESEESEVKEKNQQQEMTQQNQNNANNQWFGQNNVIQLNNIETNNMLSCRMNESFYTVGREKSNRISNKYLQQTYSSRNKQQLKLYKTENIQNNLFFPKQKSLSPNVYQTNNSQINNQILDYAHNSGIYAFNQTQNQFQQVSDLILNRYDKVERILNECDQFSIDTKKEITNFDKIGQKFIRQQKSLLKAYRNDNELEEEKAQKQIVQNNALHQYLKYQIEESVKQNPSPDPKSIANQYIKDCTLHSMIKNPVHYNNLIQTVVKKGLQKQKLQQKQYILSQDRFLHKIQKFNQNKE